MKLIRNFEALRKDDVLLAGGKGASLGEMTHAGFSVPAGFVILSTAFERFLTETHIAVEIDAALNAVNYEEIHTIEYTSEKIRALILQAEIPQDITQEIRESFKELGTKYIAVRSSATSEDSASAAWAGQLESYLNTTKEHLLENVKKCWASLFTSRAIVYRFEKNLHKQHISVAVVVQNMVASEISGIAFSVHPVTQDSNQMIIEAGFGLGEAIVSGQITPDSYVVEKKSRRILDKAIQTQTKELYRSEEGGNAWRILPKNQSKQQVLSDKEIQDLSEIIVRIENHYGFPCDIEWAFGERTFFVVQVRPITTLSENGEAKNIVYSQFSEFTFIQDGGRASYFYPYYSIVHMYSVHDDTWPLTIGMMNQTKNHFMKWYMVIKDEKELDLYLDRFIRDPLLLNTMETFITQVRDCAVKELTMIDCEKLTRNQLVNIITKYYAQFETLLRTAGTLRIIDHALLLRLRHFFRSSSNPDEMIRLASVSEMLSFSLQEEMALLELSIELKSKKSACSSREVVDKIQEIYDRYCWSVCGYYNEKAKTISDYHIILQEMMKNQPEQVLIDLKTKHTTELQKKHKAFVKLAKEGKVLVKIASNSSYLKDYFKFSISKMIHFSESLFQEIAARTGKEVSFIKDLYPKETVALLQGATLPGGLIQKRVRHCILITTPGNFSEYTNDGAEAFENRYIAMKLDTKAILQGRSASVGYGRGKAKIILNGDDFHKLKSGDVLVVTNTSPDFVPIMRRAVAIVAEEGGLTAHVSVVSREFGIPCVVGVCNATALIKDEDDIAVDANNGMVNIVSRSK